MNTLCGETFLKLRRHYGHDNGECQGLSRKQQVMNETHAKKNRQMCFYFKYHVKKPSSSLGSKIAGMNKEARSHTGENSLSQNEVESVG